jgi:hypothetical protein
MLTDRIPRRFVRAALLAAFVVLAPRPARACKVACGSPEVIIGTGAGVGAAAAVTLLAPMVTEDLFGKDGTKAPGRSSIYAATGIAAFATVAATAVTGAIVNPGYDSFFESRLVPDLALFVGTPLAVGMLAAVTTNFVLRDPTDARAMSFTVAPTPWGATGTLRLSF